MSCLRACNMIWYECKNMIASSIDKKDTIPLYKMLLPQISFVLQDWQLFQIMCIKMLLFSLQKPYFQKMIFATSFKKFQNELKL